MQRIKIVPQGGSNPGKIGIRRAFEGVRVCGQGKKKLFEERRAGEIRRAGIAQLSGMLSREAQ